MNRILSKRDSKYTSTGAWILSDDVSGVSVPTPANVEPPIVVATKGVPWGLAFSHRPCPVSGQMLVAASTAIGCIMVCELETGKVVQEWKGSSDTYCCTPIDFAFDDEYLVTSGVKYDLQLWTFSAMENKWESAPSGVLSAHTKEVTGAEFCPIAGNDSLLTSSADETVRIWTVSTRQVKMVLSAPPSQTEKSPGQILAAHWSPCAKFVITAEKNCSIRVYSTEDGAMLSVFRFVHQDTVFDAFLLRKTSTTSSSTTKEKVLTSASSTSSTSSSDNNSSRLSELNNYYIVSCSGDNTVKVFDGSFLHRLTIEDRVFGCAADHRGKFLAVASLRKALEIYRLDVGKLVFEYGHPDTLRMAKFSRDDRFVVTCCCDSTMRIFRNPILDALFRSRLPVIKLRFCCRPESRIGVAMQVYRIWMNTILFVQSTVLQKQIGS